MAMTTRTRIAAVGGALAIGVLGAGGAYAAASSDSVCQLRTSYSLPDDDRDFPAQADPSFAPGRYCP